MFLVALGTRAAWGTIDRLQASDRSALKFPDEVDYWSLAQSLDRGDGLVGEHGFRALRMPLYPGLLSMVAGVDNGLLYARVAQWLIGAVGAVLVALLAQRIAGPAAGVMAGLLVACDPFLIFFSSLLLTETVYITAQALLLLVGWPLLNRDRPAGVGRWVAVGLCAAVCVYIREASPALCVLWIVFLVTRRRFERPALTGCVVSVTVLVASLVPWAVRNRNVTGALCWLTNRAGISLYDGVGPQATGASDLGDIKQMPAVRGLDEVGWNRYFIERSMTAVRSDPVRIVRLAVVKVARTWNPVPNVDTYRSPWVRLISAAWTLPVYALALLGGVRLARRDRSALVGLLLPVICVLVLHAVFVGSVRYRLVAMPLLEVLAAVGVVEAVMRRTARPARESASRSGP